MPRKSCFRITFHLLLCVIIQGRVSKRPDLYISRASGNDSWSCNQTNPCKTIWRAVTLASRGDKIHLDGTKTENDPYPCQSETPANPGIYINKSLSLMGFGPKPPHIRCSKGLTFDGSDDAQQMHITLSGLFLNENFVYFQDSSVNIDRCTFEGSKRGVQLLIRARAVSTIEITNSVFVKNSECISVIVDKTMNPSDSIEVVFKVKNSSFYGNALSSKGSCMSFSESSHNNQFVSCKITLENVTFSHNKFSSKGLFFLDMENGNQDIYLQHAAFTNNIPLPGRDVSAIYNHSECIVRSTFVKIFINASNFTGQNARSFSVSASKISSQIYNSGFGGHIVEGKGGVMSVKGTDLCKLSVSNSSFVNTTAVQGGAFNVECAKVRFSLQENSFADNKALHGSGGAVSIDALSSGLNSYESATNGKPELSCNKQSKQHIQIDVTKCSFRNACSFSGGGAVYINASKNDFLLTVESSRFIHCESYGDGGALSVLYKSKIQIRINNSHFISNQAVKVGGGLHVENSINDEHWTINASQILIENSSFLKNSASDGGAMFVVANKKLTAVLHEVIMESNRAQGAGGVAYIVYIFSLTMRRSRFSRNTAGYAGGVLYTVHVNRIEVQDSLFEDSYARSDNSEYHGGQGGVFFLTDTTGLISITISIINTTFRNCSAEMEGGAIYLIHEGKNVTFLVQRSLFLENHSLQQLGGAIYLRLQPASEKECNGQALQSENDVNYSLWNCQNFLRFEDTTFVRNTGKVGGAIYLTTGNAIIKNCHFVDNFASSEGGHIYTPYGPAALTIQNCLFLQTMKELHLGRINYNKISFLHAESSGTLQVFNTTMDVRAYGSANPLMLITNGKEIDVGNYNLTQFYCPVGNQLEIINFTTGNPFVPETKTTTLQFSCSACRGNAYSLQRGHALGSQLVAGFQCLPCPFGANCTQNILAKRNFWGYKDQNNPLSLHFTMCPVGYCSPPQEAIFPKYNGCQGNRSGEMCGHCNESYTETLYSTNCRLSHECKDYWFWPVALIYVLLMALYFTFKPPIVPWIKRQILWFKENKPASHDDNFDKGYLKILFYFYQAANLLVVSSSSQDVIKANLIELIVGFFNFKSYSAGLICPFPGLTVVSKQFFSASHVFGTMLMICIFYVLHWGIQRFRGQGAPSVGPYVGGILQTLLLGYTTLATVSFSLLRCVSIGSEKRLFYDGNVVCFQWWQYILVGFVCTFVIPFVFVLLWGSYKLYGKTLSAGKFLLACFFPLPSLIYWVFISFCQVLRNPVNEVSTPHQVSMNSAERVLYDSFKRPEEGQKLSLSWESIMSGRRLILVVMKSFENNPMPRLLIMSLFCFLFLLHHVVAQPFRDSIANTAETISLLSIAILGMVNVFFASFVTLAVPFKDHFSSWWNICEGVEVVILCLVPAVCGLLVVIAVLSQLCRLTVVVCRFLCNFCWICFLSRYNNQNDEAKPLLAAVS